MEQDIKVLEQLKGRWRDIGFGDKMCVCTCREQLAITNILNELERLKIENKNITRELLARTEKLNEYYKTGSKWHLVSIYYPKLIKAIEQKICGKSLSAPEGWVYLNDLEEIINNFKQEEIEQNIKIKKKFSHEKEC